MFRQGLFFSYILGSAESDLHWSDEAIYIHGHGCTIQREDENLLIHPIVHSHPNIHPNMEMLPH